MLLSLARFNIPVLPGSDNSSFRSINKRCRRIFLWHSASYSTNAASYRLWDDICHSQRTLPPLTHTHTQTHTLIHLGVVTGGERLVDIIWSVNISWVFCEWRGQTHCSVFFAVQQQSGVFLNRKGLRRETQGHFNSSSRDYLKLMDTQRDPRCSCSLAILR